MALTAIPLITESFAKIMQKMGPFEATPHIAVATSGGADSLALTLLLHDWIVSLKGKLTALTIDHKLRPESKEEAYKVKKWLTRYDIDHHILTWDGEKKKTDLQNQARQARRILLERWCTEHHVLHLFLAHHADDQAETFMQRLLHASGPIGLQSMSPCIYKQFGRILRPLLIYSKKDLQSYLIEKGQEFIEDPSNQNPLFERTKIRSFLPTLQKLTSTTDPINKTIEKIQEANEITFNALTQFYLSHVRLTRLAVLKICKAAFLAESLGLQTLIFSQCLQSLSGHKYPFSSAQILPIIEATNLNKNITLGGCLIFMKKDEIWVMREKRAIPKNTPVRTTMLHWDNRFLLTIPKSLLGATVIPQPQLDQTSTEPSYVQETLPCLQEKTGKIHFFSELTTKLSLQSKLLPTVKNSN